MDSLTETMDTPALADRPALSPSKSTAWWKPAFGVIAGAALLAWFGHIGLHAYRFEETDDAYVTGHIHQVSPQLDGQVKEILIADNQTVRAGDVLVRLDPLQSELQLQKARATHRQARAKAGETPGASHQNDT